MESLVLPVEFPGGGKVGKIGKVGKGVIDWTGVEKSKLIDTIPEFGPFFSVTFDLFLNSFPIRNKKKIAINRRYMYPIPVGSLLAYQEYYGRCLLCIYLKMDPETQKTGLYVQTWDIRRHHEGPMNMYGVLTYGTLKKENLEIKKWYKIEIERRQLEEKVRIANLEVCLRIRIKIAYQNTSNPNPTPILLNLIRLLYFIKGLDA